MSKTSEAQKRATAKYAREKCVMLSLKLNKTTDADVLAKLDKVDSKQGYIKALIRADIEKGP